MKSKPELTFFVEPLERRLMLSGNVLATLLGGDLFIRGDEFDNDLSLELDDNQIVLVGNSDTTINGTADPFVVSESNTIDGKLFVKLGRGNDQFIATSGIEVERSARIYGGSGDDTIGLQGITIADKLKIKSGSGNDSIALLDVNADRVKLKSGSGDDLVSVDGVTVDRKVKISTSSGADDVVLQNSSVGGRVIITTGSGADDLVIDNSAIQGKLISVTGSGDDIVRVDDSTVQGVSLLFMNSGADVTEVTGNSEFERLRIFGGSGSDSGTAAATVVSDDIDFFSVGSNNVPADAIQARIDSPTSGAISQTAAIQSSLFNLDPTETQPDPTDTQPELLSLSLDVDSANDLTPSNGTVIATDSDFTIQGQTTANSSIEIDQNGDGLFDDGTTVADENGNFSIATTLTNDQSNFRGEQHPSKSNG